MKLRIKSLTHKEKIFRVKVIMNNLKSNINPSYNNKEYQNWLNRNHLDIKMEFRDWVIIGATKEILKIMDVS
ncbi:MAG: hypothetical protein U9R08_03620 [Nanoarchaeota archaeon]|nr:hypothetical protein [Nanoarchaeota archaeon]